MSFTGKQTKTRLASEHPSEENGPRVHEILNGNLVSRCEGLERLVLLKEVKNIVNNLIKMATAMMKRFIQNWHRFSDSCSHDKSFWHMDGYLNSRPPKDGVANQLLLLQQSSRTKSCA